MTMLISGHLISAYGWPFVFYVPGGLSILLFLVWMTKVYSSPESHPQIDEGELRYIKSSIAGGRSNSVEIQPKDHPHGIISLREVPWKAIFLSVPFWAICISQFCAAWGGYMLKSVGPKYLHSALNFDIHENSYISATPFLIEGVLCIGVGRLSDFLLENKHISMLFARKMCNSIGQWGSALAFAGLILSGCNRFPAVTCYIISGMIGGVMGVGCYINVMDISPKYAGVIEGVTNTLANIAGFGAPYLAGLILHNEV